MLLEQNDPKQLFISDINDCTKNYKSFGNVVFSIAELRIDQIDNNWNRLINYHQTGLQNFYLQPMMRVIKGYTYEQQHLVGRAIQALLN